MTAFLNIDGEAALSITLRVPNSGPWWADVVLQDAPTLSGPATLNIGDLALSGTIDAGNTGVFSEQARARIVGGGGGWGSVVASQHYHNDAGVKSKSIADDAARIAGEEIGDFAPAAANVGIDYVRESGLASRVLEDAIGDVRWWVGFDGKTHVGDRPAETVNASKYTVLHSDPAHRTATIAVEDFTAISIGSTLSEGLETPLTVRELEIVADVEAIRVFAWGTDSPGRGRLESLLRGIVDRSTDGLLYGRYRYRVVKMSGDRIELQAVSQGKHPDVLPISMKPGVSGAHAEPADSSIVLVEFIEGNRTLPIVSAFAGKDEEGHEPTLLVFSASLEMKLGSDSAGESMVLGDSMKSWLEAHTHPTGVGPSGPPAEAATLSTTLSTKIKVE